MHVETEDAVVVKIERNGSNQNGDPLWSVSVDGLLSTVELLALGRVLAERLGGAVDSTAVTGARNKMRVRP